MITKEKYEKFLSEIDRILGNENIKGSLSSGKIYWITFADHFPDLAEKIIRTENDPFNNDGNIVNLLSFLFQQLQDDTVRI